ncbi:hypothetical protein TREES_T100020123 [Tupaia chinensis]|uniref:Uncharacterized protein n=1 Tax=Tupaia chinensis TaxID=246437 RepID=L8Y4Y3_TUPCH|nr:hypothetical protein TREES_T100020123 [Tupaia chinensis]
MTTGGVLVGALLLLSLQLGLGPDAQGAPVAHGEFLGQAEEAGAPWRPPLEMMGVGRDGHPWA